jgi:hypothetical protein
MLSNRPVAASALLCALSAFAPALTPEASGAAISVPATRFGNYASDGVGNINSPGFQNYFVGYSTPSAVMERRNFFTFSTASFAGESVIAAELVLYIPKFAPPVTTDPGDGYHSPDPSEHYIVTPCPFPAAVVGDPTNAPGPSMMIWASLGTGPLAGEIEVLPTDMGTYIHIPFLPPAVAALDGPLPGTIVLGGRLTSLDHTRPMVLDELAFSSTDVPGSGVFAVPTLVLTTPAPGAGVMMLMAFGGIAAPRRRRPR